MKFKKNISENKKKNVIQSNFWYRLLVWVRTLNESKHWQSCQRCFHQNEQKEFDPIESNFVAEQQQLLVAELVAPDEPASVVETLERSEQFVASVALALERSTSVEVDTENRTEPAADILDKPTCQQLHCHCYSSLKLPLSVFVGNLALDRRPAFARAVVGTLKINKNLKTKVL